MMIASSTAAMAAMRAELSAFMTFSPEVRHQAAGSIAPAAAPSSPGLHDQINSPSGTPLTRAARRGLGGAAEQPVPERLPDRARRLARDHHADVAERGSPALGRREHRAER